MILMRYVCAVATLLVAGNLSGVVYAAEPEPGSTAQSDIPASPGPAARRVTSKELPTLVAALEANLLTGQLPGGKRVVIVRNKDRNLFPVLERFGLQERDTIRRVNGAAPRHASQIADAVRRAKLGGVLTLSVLRNGASQQMTLQFEGAPTVTQESAGKHDHDVMLLREDELEAKWADLDPWTLLVAAAPTMARDANGEVIGVTSSSFDEIPFAVMLGLRSGDIIQSVNGYAVTSEKAIVTLISELDGERFFTAVVLRNGKPLTLRYRVE